MLKQTKNFTFIDEKLDEDDNCRRSESPSTLSTSSTSIDEELREDDGSRISESPSALSTSSTSLNTTPRTSPNSDLDNTVSEPIYEQITEATYLRGQQFTQEVSRIIALRMNPFEKLEAIGRALCKIKDYWVMLNEADDVTNPKADLEHINDVYYSACDLYGELLKKLLTRAHDNKNFRQFVAIINKIPNKNILFQAEDIIHYFGYGHQLPLLRVKEKVDSMLMPTNLTGLAVYQSELNTIYQNDSRSLNRMSYFLARSMLLKNLLQKYYFDQRTIKRLHLAVDFIFVANAIKNISDFVQGNHDLHAMLELDKFWSDFATIAIRFIKAHDFEETDLHTLTALNYNNMQRTLGFLFTIYMDRVLKPSYFLEIKPEIKPMPKFLDDENDKYGIGKAMLINYHKRPAKTQIILALSDLKIIAATIKSFESYLDKNFPPEALAKFLFKAKLLQQRYIEESFAKLTDVDQLLEYYSIYAWRIDEITNGNRIDAAISEYYFHVAELLAHRYYQITGTSIPPLDHLEDYQPGNTLTMG